MSMSMNLWRVSGDEEWGYSSVVGAESALIAARKFIAHAKAAQAEEIEGNRIEYSRLVYHGEITESFEESGCRTRVVLPDVIRCVPMHDMESYHDSFISSDRACGYEAFNGLWDWQKAVEVRL